MRDVSIFRKVLLSNIKIVMIPIVMIMFIIGYMVCLSVKDEIEAETGQIVYEYAEQVKSEIEKTVSVCENIARYPMIINGLNTEYKDHYSAFMFIDDARVFIDNLTYETDSSDITICFDNDSLYDGKYFSSHTSVTEYDEIYKRFSETKSNVIWEEEIFTDETGKEYFLFYEHMPLNKGCFVICKIYIPQAPERVYVVGAEKSPDGVRADIRENINAYFDAVSDVDYNEVYSGYFKIYALLLLITFFIIALLYYTTQKTTDRVTRDINHFIEHLDVENIADGKLDLEVKSSDAAELSIIKGTISELLEQINEITNSKHKTEMEKQTLEFELLQSQIDPHTMYNSLSAIRLGAFKRHDDEMVDFVDTMTSYYRKVLNKGKTVCPLSDELDLVTKYVKINELSHYKKYNLSVDAPSSLMNEEILHLLLQPFVENAIIHGLGGSRQNCMINIKCFEEQGFMNILVEDNGRGINDKILGELNDLENNETGYGVRNALMRLKLFYGDEASVKFYSVLGEGTKVKIRYPI